MLRNLDRAALCGGLILIAALLFMGFSTLKPHRLDRGEVFPFMALFSPGTVYLMAAVLLGLLFLCCIKHHHAWLNTLCILGSNAVIWLLLFFQGQAAADYMALYPAGRVSPSLGSWLALLGSYMVILSSINKVSHKNILQFVLLLGNCIILWLFIDHAVLSQLAIMQEYYTRQDRFLQEVFTHLRLAASAVVLGIIIGIPLGITAFQYMRAEKPIFYTVNMVQTFPSLALFGLLIVPLATLAEAFPVLRDLGIGGIGWTPALIALTLYTLLPITRNTFSSLQALDPVIMEAARGMGMNRRQTLQRVQVPMALPIILGGVRTASVQTIGNTAVAALIGAGGLGTFIFQGLGQAAPDLILLGALPVIALAIMTDVVMRTFIYLVVSPVFRGGLL